MNISWKLELWSVSGPGFTLPISVFWTDETHATVRAGGGLALLKCQQEALAEVLDRHGTKSRNSWTVERSAIEMIARQQDHDDPERVVHWIPRDKLLVEFEHDGGKKHQDRYTMLAYMVQWGRFRSIPEADIVWHEFMRAALNTILRDRKPVDLLFCTVRDVPYRPDWCSQILTARTYLGATLSRDSHSRHGKRPDVLKVQTRPTRRQLEDAFGWYYRAEPLFAWSTREREKMEWDPMAIERSLHVQGTDIWRDTAYRVEREHAAVPQNYLKHVIQECQERKTELHALYRQWLQEIFAPTRTLPTAQCFHPPVYCRITWKSIKNQPPPKRRKVTKLWIRRVRAVHWPLLDRIQDSVAPYGVEPTETPPGYRGGALPDLQPLPDIQPATGILRDPGRDVAEPINQPAGTTGLLVQDGPGRYGT